MKRRAILLLLVPHACGIPLESEGGEWQESEPYLKSRDDLWSICLATLDARGWKLEAQNRDSGRIVTAWKTHMNPTWREGHRDRLEVEILAVSGTPDRRHRVRAKARREINDNSRLPQSEREAVWTYAGGNDDLRDQLLYLIKLKAKGPGLDD